MVIFTSLFIKDSDKHYIISKTKFAEELGLLLHCDRNEK